MASGRDSGIEARSGSGSGSGSELSAVEENEPKDQQERRTELLLEAEALIGSRRHLAAVRLLGEARRLSTGAARERIDRRIEEQMRLAVRASRGVTGGSTGSETPDQSSPQPGAGGVDPDSEERSSLARSAEESNPRAATVGGRLTEPETVAEERALLEHLRRTTPTERFRAAAGGRRSFLAAARAEGLSGLEATRRAEERQARHRANEALLSRLDERRRELTERRGERGFDRVCRALDKHRVALTTRRLLRLSDALRAQTAKILDEARLIERRSSLLLTRSGRRVPGSSLHERRPTGIEREVLERALNDSREEALEALEVVTGTTVSAALETHALTVRGRLASAFEQCRRRRRELCLADLVSRIRTAASDPENS